MRPIHLVRQPLKTFGNLQHVLCKPTTLCRLAVGCSRSLPFESPLFCQRQLFSNTSLHQNANVSNSNPAGYHLNTLPANFDISAEVEEAMKIGQAVVALESTIVSHGMPFPQNLETALSVEDIIRSSGAVPATIAIIDGRVKIGLTEKQLELVARSGSKALKVSRADVAAIITAGNRAQILNKTSVVGSTTVASTMLLASRAGIKVFVTGGIGGVHRDGENSMDISADLTELGRTSMCVVSAGVKSILDIGRTLEYLETQGVTTVTYGDNHDFPAFFLRDSGFKSQVSSNDVLECAQIIDNNVKLGLDSGILIGVPIPKEHVPKNANEIEKVIEEALEQAKEQGITGKKVTPFILDKVKTLSGGESLKANIELVKNNARVGAKIAVKYYELLKPSTSIEKLVRESAILENINDSDKKINQDNDLKNHKIIPELLNRQPVIIGGSGLDVTSQYDLSLKKGVDFDQYPEPGTSVPGKIHQSFGGVGRNIAEASLRTGGNPFFITAVGTDIAGQEVKSALKDLGFNIKGIQENDEINTAVYNAVLLPDGEMLTAVADMDIHSKIDLTDEIIVERFEGNQKAGGILDTETKIAPLIALDCNLSIQTINKILKQAHDNCIPVLLEPTSAVKIRKVFKESPIDLLRQITYITPNKSELLEIAKVLYNRLYSKDGNKFDDENEYLSIEDSIALVSDFIPNTILKRGPLGIVAIGRRSVDLYSDSETNPISRPEAVEIKPNETILEAVSVTGAGDSLVGTLITVLSTLHVTKFKAFLEKELGIKLNESTVKVEGEVGLNKEELIRQAIAQGGVIDQRMFVATLEELVSAVRIGMMAAEMSLNSKDAISKDLGPDLIKN